MKADSLIRNYFKIVPKGHNNCQLSIANCQFGGAAKFQFDALSQYDEMKTSQAVNPSVYGLAVCTDSTCP